MTRSNTTPRTLSADRLRDALDDIGGPARPDYLADIVTRAGRTPQRPAWTFLERWLSVDIAARRAGAPRTAVVFATVLLVVALVATVMSVASRVTPQPVLPTSPRAWERVVVETPYDTGRVASLAAGPNGLLASVGGDEPARLAVSTDGLTWSLVPEDRHPPLSNDRGFGLPVVVGTDRGFLMLSLDEVWLSEDGSDWRRLTAQTFYPDLASTPDAATAYGAGLVGVGGAQAWHSADGSDWSVAEVPALPDAILAAPESERFVAMNGVAAAGDDLVAWGIAAVPVADSDGEHLVLPLLWASRDGRTWSDVAGPAMERVTAVTAGPDGFVAIGRAGSTAAVWQSRDGQEWVRVDEGAFAATERFELNAAVATRSGYVIAGTEGACASYPCAAQEIVIWTSPDGRVWSRVARAGHLAASQAHTAAASGSRFLIGGTWGGRPALWISRSP